MNAASRGPKAAAHSSTIKYRKHIWFVTFTQNEVKRGCSPLLLADMDIPLQEPATEKRGNILISWCSPLWPRSPGTPVTWQTHQLLPSRWEVSSRQPACLGPMAAHTPVTPPMSPACPAGRGTHRAPVTHSAAQPGAGHSHCPIKAGGSEAFLLVWSAKHLFRWFRSSHFLWSIKQMTERTTNV